MKKLKKLLSIVLAVAMVLSLVVVTNAASGSLSITINNSASGYTYVAYQVFDGDVDGNTMTNVVWGDGVDGGALLIALKTDTTTVTASTGEVEMNTLFGSCSSAADVANVLATENAYSDVVNEFAKLVNTCLGTATTTVSTQTGNTYVLDGLDAGYYFVKNTVAPDGGSYSSYILNVTSSTAIDTKQSVPSMTKNVMETDDTDGSKTGWQDTADYDIGDSVPFRLTGTVASNIADYSTYSYTFHDALSEGLDYDAGSVVVTIYPSYTVGTDGVLFPDGTGVVVSSGYIVNTDTSSCSYTGCDFEVVFADLKSCVDANGATISITSTSLVVVEFTATLNTNAEIGNPGNPNTALLEYSNNPYDSTTTDETPWDTVVVFTYEVDVNKVTSDSSALEGAQFTLYKQVKYSSTSGLSYLVYDSTTNEYVTPTTTLSDGDTCYIKVKEITTAEANADGKLNVFKFSGLDDGTYVLKETYTPTGYNTMTDITFDVVATINSNATHGATTVDGEDVDNYTENYLTSIDTSGLSSISTSATDGLVTANVVNQKGSELPSTGGIGTTIFYVVGGVLVLGAVVLLITRKRLGSED